MTGPTSSLDDDSGKDDNVRTKELQDGQKARPASIRAVFLPFEIVLQIIKVLQAQWLSGDSSAERALIAFSQTNSTIREWALDALYRVMILPRHVREFRKFYHRQRTSFQPFTCAGYTRALFCGLDDVSRLNAMTAGWEADLVRLLHYIGPHLEHLSLWTAESKIILRDASQVKGSRRMGALQPALQPTWDEPSLDDVDFPLPQQPGKRNSKAQGAAGDHEGGEDDDPLPNVHDLPGWLRAEYEKLPLKEFYRRHKAHVAFRTKTSDVLLVQQRQRGCRPRFLSMVVSFPFYENEGENAFPHMKIFSRVEELDFHVPVTKDVAKVLNLTSLLQHSPLRKLRITSQHASIALAIPPYVSNLGRAATGSSSNMRASQSHKGGGGINLALGLGRLCASSVLFDLLMAEFQGHHAGKADMDRLQAVLEAAVLSAADGDEGINDAELWQRSQTSTRERPRTNRQTESNEAAGCNQTSWSPFDSSSVRSGSLASTLGVGLRISDTQRRGSDADEWASSSPPRLLSEPWKQLPSYRDDDFPGISGQAQAQEDRVRVRIQQRGQDMFGKLRVRLQDFKERAEFGGPGWWARMGVSDEYVSTHHWP
ncbi:hypothetical protein OC846_000224 [Tilletia horrida]|uniref:Uncharacterized protein n=1 Tax=Tilletia horrida TaxID=155126 RepID=A0AAN6JUU1_9BASI|nr:hypothetical protein OC846_000224 [Tilletia horrida]KAK0566457.1 hypothetical protein OC861_003235 [Tilletia horrida]